MATKERSSEASHGEAPAEAGEEVAGSRPAIEGPCSEGQGSRRTATPTRPINQLTEQLAARGFGYVDDFVEPTLLSELRGRCLSLHDSGALRPARIGRGANERLAPDVRGDFIAWLSEPTLDAEQVLLGRLEELRVALNRALMTGLEDFQGHFALYPPGAAYARHSDRLEGTDVRAISVALYLNEAWPADDGGVLRIHTDGAAFEDVLPRGGQLVAFQSDRFEHEVLPARRERLSFTGWYRRRSLEGFA
jgi:SM-20-related protein